MGKLVVVLDTETTGLGPFRGREDGVVQIGYAYRSLDTGKVQKWSEVCNPGRRYLEGGRADEALAINRRTIDEILDARKAVSVAADLRAQLRELEAEHGPLDLRAYNCEFDQHFLEGAPWRIEGSWGPCLMKLAHRHLNSAGRWPRLTAACEMLDIKYPGRAAHDAANDAHAALLVYEALEGQVRRVPVREAKPKPSRTKPAGR